MTETNRKPRMSDSSYICRDCAKRLGGQWPEGHVATCHMGTCGWCLQTKSLAHHYDWQLDSAGNYREMNWETWD